jgi:hypothetical protein
VPFRIDDPRSIRRAERVGGQVRHLLPREVHGDPLSPEGLLVFHDFGWDLLDRCRDAGFERVSLCVYWSYLYGHLGCPQFYFRAIRGHG